MLAPASLNGTIQGMDPLTLAQALESQLQQELAAQTQQKTQAAQQAGQEYQQAASAPAPQLGPFEQLIPALFGNVASVLAQNPVFGERGQEQIQQSRADMLKRRADSLAALKDNYENQAREAQKAGDLEREATLRTKFESISRQYDTIKQNADRTFQAEQRELDRKNLLEREKVQASRPQGGATGQDFDPNAVAQAIRSGQIPPESTGFSRGQWGIIVGKLRQQDPKFSVTKAMLDWQGARQYVRSLNQGQQVRLRQNAQNAMTTASLIKELVNEIQQAAPPRTPVTAINRLQLNSIKNGAYGPQAAEAATRLEAQIAAWRLEMANVYSGGYAAQEAHLKEANRLIDPNWSIGRILAGLDIGERDTNIRLNAVNEVGAVTPSNPLEVGGGAVQQLNIGPNAIPVGPQGQSQSPPGLISVEAPNGKTYYFKTQKEADAFKKRAGL